jgi:hypothetical protein
VRLPDHLDKHGFDTDETVKGMNFNIQNIVNTLFFFLFGGPSQEVRPSNCETWIFTKSNKNQATFVAFNTKLKRDLYTFDFWRSLVRCRVPSARLALHSTKLRTKFRIFREKIYFVTELTSEKFLSIFQNLKVTRLQGCTQTKP